MTDFPPIPDHARFRHAKDDDPEFYDEPEYFPNEWFYLKDLPVDKLELACALAECACRDRSLLHSQAIGNLILEDERLCEAASDKEADRFGADGELVETPSDWTAEEEAAWHTRQAAIAEQTVFATNAVCDADKWRDLRLALRKQANV